MASAPLRRSIDGAKIDHRSQSGSKVMRTSMGSVFVQVFTCNGHWPFERQLVMSNILRLKNLAHNSGSRQPATHLCSRDLLRTDHVLGRSECHYSRANAQRYYGRSQLGHSAPGTRKDLQQVEDFSRLDVDLEPSEYFHVSHHHLVLGAYRQGGPTRFCYDTGLYGLAFLLRANSRTRDQSPWRFHSYHICY